MSNIRVEPFAEATIEELAQKINQFLARDNVEHKKTLYATNGYEKPYSALVLYHEKEPATKTNKIEWHGKKQ